METLNVHWTWTKWQAKSNLITCSSSRSIFRKSKFRYDIIQFGPTTCNLFNHQVYVSVTWLIRRRRSINVFESTEYWKTSSPHWPHSPLSSARQPPTHFHFVTKRYWWFTVQWCALNGRIFVPFNLILSIFIEAFLKAFFLRLNNTLYENRTVAVSQCEYLQLPLTRKPSFRWRFFLPALLLPLPPTFCYFSFCENNLMLA